MLTADALYADVGLLPTAITAWGDDVLSTASGVYVIAVEDMDAIRFLKPFEEKERARWKDDQSIIYIGRAINLRRRLRQFRRHDYGRSAPHAGGQAILLLDCPKLIHWAETDDYQSAEDRLIKAFEKHAGRRPFGNRIQASRLADVLKIIPV